MNGMSFKKEECNISSLLPKIDKVHHTANATNVSIIGISETKLDEIILSSESQFDGYNLRLDRSRIGGSVACSIKSLIAYSYKDNFCSNTESIFFDIFLPKSQPILVGILYRPPDNQTLLNKSTMFSYKLGFQINKSIISQET